mmetsp:Transcript_21574/g.24086  ORF Transcript_21574/g.24086 Transcript_21574/m.24086 type:complete len:104 (+) Transcript_21574:33-344(+)
MTDDIEVALLGGTGVGKSSTAIQFAVGNFIEDYDPTIEDLYRKPFIVDDKPVRLNIFDTAGGEDFKALRDMRIRNGDCFIVLYSITDRQSFEEIPSILGSIAR